MHSCETISLHPVEQTVFLTMVSCINISVICIAATVAVPSSLVSSYSQFCVSVPVGFAERRSGRSQGGVHVSQIQQQARLAGGWMHPDTVLLHTHTDTQSTRVIMHTVAYISNIGWYNSHHTAAFRYFLVHCCHLHWLSCSCSWCYWCLVVGTPAAPGQALHTRSGGRTCRQVEVSRQGHELTPL